MAAPEKAAPRMAAPGMATPEKAAPPKMVWLVYNNSGIAVNQPPLLVSVEESEQAALATIEAVKAHEEEEGWTPESLAVLPMQIGFNYMISGKEGPLILK